MAGDDRDASGRETLRTARLAAALRENLKRRKAQSRARMSDRQESQPEPAGDLLTTAPEGKD